MYKIYIVEDDFVIGKFVKKNLGKWGFEVYLAENFENILGEFLDISPHLVLMDISLPYFDGYYYLQKIRKYSQIPVLFISSRSDKPEKIMAMTLGGDDYIEKPFNMDVLVAKINALLRRSYTFTEESTILTYKGIILNLKNNILSYGGREAELTKNEFLLMEEFFKNPEKILNRDDLMEILWKSHIFIDDNSLTVNISRLRTKLKKLGLDDVIQTKKSQGYIFIKENAL